MHRVKRSGTFQALPGRSVLHRRMFTLAAVPLLLIGCGDLDPVPPAELENGEPVATMRFSEGLPSLPGLAQRWVRDRSLDPIVKNWTDSWDRAEGEGEQTRAEAIRSASPFLVEAMPAGELERVIGEVTRALEAVEEVLLDSDPMEGLTGPLRGATEAHRTAQIAFENGEFDRALSESLLASDHLRRTTPEALARALVRRGEEEMGRISGSAPYTEVSVARASRLLIGAREALEAGENTLALRRAWYAVGLLESGEGRDGSPPYPPESENPGS